MKISLFYFECKLFLYWGSNLKTWAISLPSPWDAPHTPALSTSPRCLYLVSDLVQFFRFYNNIIPFPSAKIWQIHTLQLASENFLLQLVWFLVNYQVHKLSCPHQIEQNSSISVNLTTCHSCTCSGIWICNQNKTDQQFPTFAHALPNPSRTSSLRVVCLLRELYCPEFFNSFEAEFRTFFELSAKPHVCTPSKSRRNLVFFRWYSRRAYSKMLSIWKQTFNIWHDTKNTGV